MTLLATILAHKAAEVRTRQTVRPLAALRLACAGAPQIRPFAAALSRRLAAGEPAVIAEIKKASPSKGLLRADFHPAKIAASYAAAGAACLSILTDEKFFQGHDSFFREARDAVNLPCLRKDFLIEPYQVYESRLLGADCILLIVAALSMAKLTELYNLARELDMSVLVEVHNRMELEQALQLQPEIIGINNRDLHTFETSFDTSARLRAAIPAGAIVVTESGIRTRADVCFLRTLDIHCFLIGETLMRAPCPGDALRELFGPWELAENSKFSQFRQPDKDRQDSG